MYHLKKLLFTGTAGMPDEDKGRVIVVNALCLLTMSLAGVMGTALFFISRDYGILVSAWAEVFLFSGIIVLNHKRKYLLACIGFLFFHNMAVIYFGICRQMAEKEQLLTVFLCITVALIFKHFWQTLLALLFTLSILGIEIYCSGNGIFTGLPLAGERILFHNLGLTAIIIMIFVAIYCSKFHDATLNKSLQKNLQEYNEQLEKIVARRTGNIKHFTRTLMHEVGTELAALFTISSTVFQRLCISKETSTKEPDEITSPQATIDRLTAKVKNVHRITLRLKNIVKNTLSLASIETGDFFNLNITNFALGSWVAELSEIMQIIADGKSITIVPDYGANLPEYVLSDRQLLDHAVRNLLSNAIRFSPEHSFIRLGVYSDVTPAPMLCIEVEDHGPGILRDNIEDIFLPYVTQGDGGTGLGLAMVKTVSNYLGGSIDVVTEIDKGSTFRMRIPLVAGSEEKVTAANENSKLLERLSGDRELRILIADDDFGHRISINFMVKQLGCQPYTADNGEECIRKVTDLRPDILFVDARMPGMGGEEVMAAVRAMADPELSQIPIIIYTADPYFNPDSRFEQYLADSVLQKPCTLLELCDSLNTAIRNASLRLQKTPIN